MPTVILIAVLSVLFFFVWTYFYYFIRNIFTKNAPYVWTFNSQFKFYRKILKKDNWLNLKSGMKLVDLGCGDGKALRFFVKEFGVETEWYDINLFAILYGKFLNKILRVKNIKLYRDYFQKADLKKYDVIYLYLLPDQLADIEDWVFKAKKKDAIIFCNTFQFAKNKPFEEYKNWKWDKVLLYR